MPSPRLDFSGAIAIVRGRRARYRPRMLVAGSPVGTAGCGRGAGSFGADATPRLRTDPPLCPALEHGRRRLATSRRSVEVRIMSTNRRIRVLHVLGALNRAGAETWLMNVLRHIDRERFQLDFVVHTTAPGAYDPEVRRARRPDLPLPGHAEPAAVPPQLEGHPPDGRPFRRRPQPRPQLLGLCAANRAASRRSHPNRSQSLRHVDVR